MLNLIDTLPPAWPLNALLGLVTLAAWVHAVRASRLAARALAAAEQARDSGGVCDQQARRDAAEAKRIAANTRLDAATWDAANTEAMIALVGAARGSGKADDAALMAALEALAHDVADLNRRRSLVASIAERG